MKNYLIVGHSSGIGKNLSTLLGKENRVYGTYNQSAIVTNTDNISSHPLDVLKEYDLSFLPDSLDGLVYCPGAINLKPFTRISEEEFISDYKLQVTGAIKIIQHCLPLLKKSGQASIVLFSSVAATTGFNFHSLVSSSKGAVEGLVKALAAEYAPAIRVNGIALSITDTPLAERLLNTPEKIAINARRHPLQAIGAPEDAAELAAFLLSSKSKWMTGQIITLDGGITGIK